MHHRPEPLKGAPWVLAALQRRGEAHGDFGSESVTARRAGRALRQGPVNPQLRTPANAKLGGEDYVRMSSPGFGLSPQPLETMSGDTGVMRRVLGISVPEVVP